MPLGWKTKNGGKLTMLFKCKGSGSMATLVLMIND